MESDSSTEPGTTKQHVKTCHASAHTTHGTALGFAISFLTRLGQARLAHDALLAQSISYFSLVGLFLGALLTTPLAFFVFFNHAIEAPLLWAWFYVLTHLWLSRGLHHDGLTDVVDGLGGTPSFSLSWKNFSAVDSAQQETFWRIVKDSHLGAFGAMALIMALGGETLAVAEHIKNAQSLQNTSLLSALYALIPLVLAPAFSRTLCTLFICLNTAKNPQSLGGKVGAGKSSLKAFCHGLLALLFCLPLSFTKGGIAIILCSLFLFFLSVLSRRYGGYNGDFLGMLIVSTQLLYLLCM